jgi:6-phosphogluconolactonase
MAARAAQPIARRLTMTLPVLDAAAHVAFLVSGSDKAERLRQVLAEDGSAPLLPAERVRPTNGSVTWLLDGAAAALLRRSG